MVSKHILHVLFYVCATLYGVAQTFYTQIDTPDTVVMLKDVDIVLQRRRPILDIKTKPGSFRLGAESLAKMPGLLGSLDPVRAMQSLPMVSSSDCISGGIYVQGSENSHNRVNVDGIEIYNPLHMLGLFSVFNTSHFDTFDVEPQPSSALTPNFVGANINANTIWHHPAKFSADVITGLIETHATVKVPLQDTVSSLILSGRATYINALYSDAIKIENAPMKYSFSDFNATYLHTLQRDWSLKFSTFYNRDKMRVIDPNYSSDIGLGWENLALGISLRKDDKQLHTIGYSRFANHVNITYADIIKRMPSEISDVSYNTVMTYGIFGFGGGLSYRSAIPQQQSDISVPFRNATHSIESYLGLELPIKLVERLRVVPGMKLSYYHSAGYNHLTPLPMLSIKYDTPCQNSHIELAVRHRVQFTHKIEESAIGFPTDFWILADDKLPPLNALEGIISFQGNVFDGVNYYIGGFYRKFDNLIDWMGNLFSMLDKDYDPLSDAVMGIGRSYGLATMLQYRWGNINVWTNYTLSKSQQQFDGCGNNWYPYSHDRTHDFKVNMTWGLNPNITLSAMFVYATGNPYTEPKYGYMIGENLILEFKGHNLSRLPAMHRLDIGAIWTFKTTSHLTQSLNVGVYNAYGHDNVMFKSYTFTPELGINPTKWSMDYIIPSISYCVKFN